MSEENAIENSSDSGSFKLKIGDRVCIKLKNKPKGTVTRVFEDEHPFFLGTILRTYLVQCDNVKYSGFYNRHNLKRLIPKSKRIPIQLKVGYIYETPQGLKFLVYKYQIIHTYYSGISLSTANVGFWNKDGSYFLNNSIPEYHLVKEIGPWDPNKEY